jgi:HKD family nuclease
MKRSKTQLQVRTSSPLKPIATRMRELSERCSELLVMSAFVSREALAHVTEAAAERRAMIKVVTGTFGNVTRKVTFRDLLKLAKQKKAEVRIWACLAHRNLHAKLYIWRLANGAGVAWIGSANLTDGGVQNEGELIAEVTGGWDAPAILSLRNAFAKEWSRGTAIDDGFIASYAEAPRSRPEPVFKRKRKRRLGPRPAEGKRPMFVTQANRDIPEGSQTYKRIDRLLGTAENWYLGRGGVLKKARVGDRCLFVDLTDGTIGLVEVVDLAKDGGGIAMAYDTVDAWYGFNKRTRARLGALGLKLSPKGLRAQWVPKELEKGVRAAIRR